MTTSANSESVLANATSLRAREWYSPDEAAQMIGRAVYTVREWCRLKRLAARKRDCGRGRHRAWEIHAEELWRYLEHGLRPAARS